MDLHHTQSILGDDTYRYTALPPGECIRLLRLNPGEADDNISISLQAASLRDCAPYTALSYVWGTAANGFGITCDGHQLMIQRNLYSALQALREISAPKLIWADAICINQEGDIREKNHQVALMGKIYKRATEVIIWLGPDDDRIARNAFCLAQEIATHTYPLLERHQPEIPPRSQVSNDLEWYAMVKHAGSHALAQLSASESKRWDSLSMVYRSPWFTRVWVIQEAGLAKHATVLCGTTKILWQQLVDAAGCIDDRASALAEHFGMTRGLQQCVDLYWLFSPTGCHRTFIETLEDVRSFQATNPLDKVYALLSHPSAMTTSGDVLLEPDYSWSPDEMSFSLALNILRETNSLQLLSAVQHDDSKNVFNDPLPSFIPRWNRKPAANMLWAGVRSKTYQTSLTYPARYSILGPHEGISVTAISVDVVSSVGSQMTKEIWRGTDAERRAPLECLAGLVGSQKEVTKNQHMAYERRVEVFLMTLTCGMFMGTTNDLEAYALGCGFLPAYSSFLFPTDLDSTQERNHITGDEERFVAAAEVWSPHRKPFITKKGYIGLGPKVMQQDDIVFVLLGCMVPFVLRKSEGTRFKLVGECYLHGIMKGEIIQELEGSLTDYEVEIVIY